MASPDEAALLELGRSWQTAQRAGNRAKAARAEVWHQQADLLRRRYPTASAVEIAKRLADTGAVSAVGDRVSYRAVAKYFQQQKCTSSGDATVTGTLPIV